MAGRLLKKEADGPKRLARTLAPPKKAPKRAIKNRKTCFLQSKGKIEIRTGLSLRHACEIRWI